MVQQSNKTKNQQRTAIVYFGDQRQDYLCLAQANKTKDFLDFVQTPLQRQLTPDHHHPNCNHPRYTNHGKRMRSLQGWLGAVIKLPIFRVRCCGCGAVFTVLPSFILRYRRQDADCLGKLLTLSLGIGLSQRHTALIYGWNGNERSWTPGRIWDLLQWLGNLMPVCWLLLRLGLNPPDCVLSDEKFADLNGLRIYLFAISQGELIWHTETLEQVEQENFEPAIENFLATVNDEISQLNATPEYTPQNVTTDGWEPVQKAWKVKILGIHLLECRWHGRKRINSSLKDFKLKHPDLPAEKLHQLKTKIHHLWTAPSRASYSQRLRRLREAWGDDKILSRRFEILKQKRFLFTEYLNSPQASAVLAPLDRSLRFLDEKLKTFGSFGADERINPMLNAWAIVNNMRQFLPDAQRAGKSLIEDYGVDLRGLPWMQALNLCTVGRLEDMLPASA